MKKLLVVLMIAMLAVAGCGNNNAADDANNAGNTETPGTQGEQAGTENQDEQPATEGFVFEANGVKIAPDADMATLLEGLGEPNTYFEAASCAFEGLDKTYNYGSYEIYTYPEADKDYVSSILLKDDMVETPEGVSLFMTMDDMIAAYGDGYVEEQGMYVYKKGDMKLKFVIQENEIISIEYASTVLEVE